MWFSGKVPPWFITLVSSTSGERCYYTKAMLLFQPLWFWCGLVSAIVPQSDFCTRWETRCWWMIFIYRQRYEKHLQRKCQIIIPGAHVCLSKFTGCWKWRRKIAFYDKLCGSEGSFKHPTCPIRESPSVPFFFLLFNQSSERLNVHHFPHHRQQVLL